MNELEPSKAFRPIRPDAFDAALDNLVSLINNPLVTGAVVDQENLPSSPAPIPPTTTPPILSPSAQGNPHDIPVASLSGRLFFTGRLCSGKDHTAKKIGADIFGFADPMYGLAEYLLNIKVTANAGKDAAGVRKFLQTIGQWGRAEVSDQYPHTTERCMFALMIRSLASQNCLPASADWARFGLTQDFWIDALLKRIEMPHPGGFHNRRVVVTNCRFPNEYRKLTDAGFQHFHCACSPSTWLARLSERKLKPDSPELKDLSEKMATDLNADLTKKLSANKIGNKMRVVWSDEKIPCPSPRLYTVQEFVQLANQ